MGLSNAGVTVEQTTLPGLLKEKASSLSELDLWANGLTTAPARALKIDCQGTAYRQIVQAMARGEEIDAVEFLERCEEQIVFITGNAGSSKSTTLKRFVAATKKRVVVAAPTGVAALNCKGVTIHKLFGMPARLLDSTEIQQIGSRQRKVVKDADIIIIDEISMCRADMLDAIDEILRAACHTNRAFGGKQIILIGDQFQLSPVAKTSEWDAVTAREKYASPYFFSSKVIRNSNILVVNMAKIFRQSESERKFIDILNAVRVGKISDEQLQELNSRVRLGVGLVSGYVHIFPTNREVDAMNAMHIGEVPGELVEIKGSISGDFKPTDAPCDDPVRIKIGAQVMLTANAQDGSYVNGSVGEIHSIEQQGFSNEYSIKVKLAETGKIVLIEKFTWDRLDYKLNGETRQYEHEILGSFTQFPIRLGAAITAHKVQGKSLDKAIVSPDNIFDNGQLYVILSRVRSLGGLVLSSPVKRSAVMASKNALDWLEERKTAGRYVDVHQVFLDDQKIVPVAKTEEERSPIQRLEAGEDLSVPELESLREIKDLPSLAAFISILDRLIIERLSKAKPKKGKK